MGTPDVRLAPLPPLREYQREMLDAATRQDSIIYLETGMGKTRIAVEAIAMALPTMRKYGQIAVFLAPSVPLVRQQAEVLASVPVPNQDPTSQPSQPQVQAAHQAQGEDQANTSEIQPDGATTDAKPAQSGRTQGRNRRRSKDAAAAAAASPGGAERGTGGGGAGDSSRRGGGGVPGQLLRVKWLGGTCVPESWGRERWTLLLRGCDVLVCTPAVLLGCLVHAMIKVSQIGMIVMDEVHHCRAQHPYAVLIREFVGRVARQSPGSGGGGGAAGISTADGAGGSSGAQEGPSGGKDRSGGAGAAACSGGGGDATSALPRPRLLGLTASPLDPLRLQTSMCDSRLVTPSTLEALAACPSRPKARIRWVGPDKPLPPPPLWYGGGGGSCYGGGHDPQQQQQMLPPEQQDQRCKQLQSVLKYCKALLELAERVVGMRDRLQRLTQLGEVSYEELGLAGDGIAAALRPSASLGRGEYDASIKDIRLLKSQVAALDAALTELGPWPALVLATADLFSSSAGDGPPPDVSPEELTYDDLLKLMDSTDLGPPPTQEKCRELMADMEELQGALRSMALPLLSYGDAVQPIMGERLAAVVLALVMEGLLEMFQPPKEEATAIAAGYGVALLSQGGMKPGGRDRLGPWASRLLHIVSIGELQQQVLGVTADPAVAAGFVPGAPLPAGLATWRGCGCGDGGGLALVSHRVCWLMRQLHRRALQASRAGGGGGGQDSAAAADGSAGGGFGGDVTRPWSAMVFCERKTTCEALSRLIAALPALRGLLRAAVFVGTSGWATTSSRDRRKASGQKRQERVRQDFAAGRLNLLLSTSVGAEGLDFSHCALVAALDLPKHVTPLVQSGGRARAQDSEHWLLVTTTEEEAAATKLLREEERMLSLAQSVAIANQQAMVISGSDSDEDNKGEVAALEADQDKDHAFEIPSTGARLPAVWAVDLLLQICTQLPGNDGCTALSPLFRWQSSGPSHACSFSYRVFLPANLGMAPVDGPECSSKDLAKKLACLEAVRQLWQRGDLDDHLRLRFTRREVTRAAHAAAFGGFQYAIPKATLTHRLPWRLRPAIPATSAASAPPPAAVPTTSAASTPPPAAVPTTSAASAPPPAVAGPAAAHTGPSWQDGAGTADVTTAAATVTTTTPPGFALYHLYCFVVRPKGDQGSAPGGSSQAQLWPRASYSGTSTPSGGEDGPFSGLLPWPLRRLAANTIKVAAGGKAPANGPRPPPMPRQLLRNARCRPTLQDGESPSCSRNGCTSDDGSSADCTDLLDASREPAAAAATTAAAVSEEGAERALCWGVLLHGALPENLPEFELFMPRLGGGKGEVAVLARAEYLGPLPASPPLRRAFNALGHLANALSKYPCPLAMTRAAAAAAAAAAGRVYFQPRTSLKDFEAWSQLMGFSRLQEALRRVVLQAGEEGMEAGGGGGGGAAAGGGGGDIGEGHGAAACGGGEPEGAVGGWGPGPAAGTGADTAGGGTTPMDIEPEAPPAEPRASALVTTLVTADGVGGPQRSSSGDSGGGGGDGEELVGGPDVCWWTAVPLRQAASPQPPPSPPNLSALSLSWPLRCRIRRKYSHEDASTRSRQRRRLHADAGDASNDGGDAVANSDSAAMDIADGGDHNMANGTTTHCVANGWGNGHCEGGTFGRGSRGDGAGPGSSDGAVVQGAASVRHDGGDNEPGSRDGGQQGGLEAAELLAAAASRVAGGAEAASFIDWEAVWALATPPLPMSQDARYTCRRQEDAAKGKLADGPPPKAAGGSAGPASCGGEAAPPMDPSLKAVISRHGLLMSLDSYNLCGVQHHPPAAAVATVNAEPCSGIATAATALAAGAATAAGPGGDQSEPAGDVTVHELGSYGRGRLDWFRSAPGRQHMVPAGAAVAAAAAAAGPQSGGSGDIGVKGEEKQTSGTDLGDRSRGPGGDLGPAAGDAPPEEESGQAVAAGRIPMGAKRAGTLGTGSGEDPAAAAEQDSNRFPRQVVAAGGREDAAGGGGGKPPARPKAAAAAAAAAAAEDAVGNDVAMADGGETCTAMSIGPEQGADVLELPEEAEQPANAGEGKGPKEGGGAANGENAAVAHGRGAVPTSGNGGAATAEGSGAGAASVAVTCVAGGSKRRRGKGASRRDAMPLQPELIALFPMDFARWRLLHGLPAIMWRLEVLVSASELLGTKLRPAGFAPAHVPAPAPAHPQEGPMQDGSGRGPGQADPEGQAGQIPLVLTATALACPAARDPWVNNDRLEYLGDAVLKLLAHIYVFLRERHVATSHEGVLSFMRDSYVANEVLAAHALNDRLDLAAALRALPFEPSRAMRQARLAPDEDKDGTPLPRSGLLMPPTPGDAAAAAGAAAAIARQRSAAGANQDVTLAAAGDVTAAEAEAGADGIAGAGVGACADKTRHGEATTARRTTCGDGVTEQAEGDRAKTGAEAAGEAGQVAAAVADVAGVKAGGKGSGSKATAKGGKRPQPPRQRPVMVTRVLKDINGKRLADCVEALIGAHLLPALEAQMRAQMQIQMEAGPSQAQAQEAVAVAGGDGGVAGSRDSAVVGPAEVCGRSSVLERGGTCSHAVQSAVHDALCFCVAAGLLPPDTPDVILRGLEDLAPPNPAPAPAPASPRSASVPTVNAQQQRREGTTAGAPAQAPAASPGPTGRGGVLEGPSGALPAVLQRHVAAAEELLGYRFRHPGLCLQALTHVSHPHAASCGGGYQRVEFLGDAVLGMVVSLWAFRDGGTAEDMTVRRRDLVSNGPLAAAAVRCGLHTLLRCGSCSLVAEVNRFAAAYLAALAECGPGGSVVVSTAERLAQNKRTERRLQQRQREGSGTQRQPQRGDGEDGEDDDEAAAVKVNAGGAEQGNGGDGGGKSDSEGTAGGDGDVGGSAPAQVLRAPKALADLLEALVGAVYLDSEGDLAAAEGAVARMLGC